MEQDPFGAAYIDGGNLYEALGAAPVNYTDPLGLVYGVSGGKSYLPNVQAHRNDPWNGYDFAAVGLLGGIPVLPLFGADLGALGLGAAGKYLGALAGLGAALTSCSQGGGEEAPDDEVVDAAKAIQDYLGDGYTVESSPTSDLYLRSADGTRSVRFDLTDSHGLDPHINIESWEPRNLFPGDPRMIRTGNLHVFPDP